MKLRYILAGQALLFLAEAAAFLSFSMQRPQIRQDAIAINEVLQRVQDHWGQTEPYPDSSDLDYVVLDQEDRVLFRTRAGLSESVNQAVTAGDTILDVKSGGRTMGKIIFHNNSAQIFQKRQRELLVFLAVCLFLQCCLCAGFFLYLNHTILKPFARLKHFAERIAAGNLDIPLTMDRRNRFGAFTESFDLMRCELKRARLAEARANAAKKELAAKLSHDIKTPIASIRAASELGAALSSDTKIQENYRQIIQKADQIHTLVSNLLSAALEEISHLTVSPADLESRELGPILENSDYLRRTSLPAIPECLLFADKLRLQQVFDNIFANSYKYANTKIDTAIFREGGYLAVTIEDSGGGVDSEDLPLLTQKFKRGKNTETTEGAGLGLYLSDYFMKEMQGELLLENGRNGLKVTVLIRLCF